MKKIYSITVAFLFLLGLSIAYAADILDDLVQKVSEIFNVLELILSRTRYSSRELSRRR